MLTHHPLSPTSDLTSRFTHLLKQKAHFLNRPVPAQPFSQTAFVASSEQTGKTLQVVAQKVGQLRTILAKSNVFNREDQQVDQLSAFINTHIALCQQEVAQLEQQHTAHPTLQAPVCSILQGRILTLTGHFKKLLQLRTQDLKSFEARKQDSYGNQPAQQTVKKRKKIDYARRNIFLEEERQDVGIDMGQVGLQETRREQRNRNQSMRQVESLLTEISGVFQKLGSIVQHHEVMIDRIDKHTEDTRLLVDKGKTSLTKTYDQVSSNRMLIIKVLLVLFIFSFVYITFLL